jgi:hypothetical protein
LESLSLDGIVIEIPFHACPFRSFSLVSLEHASWCTRVLREIEQCSLAILRGKVSRPLTMALASCVRYIMNSASGTIKP